MDIKCIVSTLGLMSWAAQQQEQLWSNPQQQLHQLCAAALGKSLRTPGTLVIYRAEPLGLAAVEVPAELL